MAGGIIGAMLAGGGEGAGNALAYQGKAWTDKQHQDALNEAQALRARSLADFQGNIQGKLETEVRQPFQREQNEAQRASSEGIHAADRTAREYKPKELLDYYSASARRLNAEADAIRDGLKYKPQAEKPALPSIKVEKDAEGNVYQLDVTSGAVGRLIPGQPSMKGESRWFGPNDPDTPASQPTIEWSLNGKRLPNGLSDLYPAIRERTGAGGGGSASGVDWSQYLGGTQPTPDPLNLRGKLPSRPPLSDFFGGSGKPPQAAIDALKKDPGLADQFKQKYAVDPSGYLKGPASQSSANPLPVSSSRSVTRVMPQLITAPPGRSTPKEKHQASMSKLRAENEAHYAQRIADTFKSIIEMGRYTPDDRPFLELAIERGALTASEKKIAQEMLEAIGEKAFEVGYEAVR